MKLTQARGSREAGFTQPLIEKFALLSRVQEHTSAQGLKALSEKRPKAGQVANGTGWQYTTQRPPVCYKKTQACEACERVFLILPQPCGL